MICSVCSENWTQLNYRECFLNKDLKYNRNSQDSVAYQYKTNSHIYPNIVKNKIKTKQCSHGGPSQRQASGNGK